MKLIEKIRLLNFSSLNKEEGTNAVGEVVKYVVIILIMLQSVSCLTVRKIERNCYKFAKVCITDTEIKTVVEYQDTTIFIHDSVFVQLPADTVTLTDTVTIRDNKAYLPEVRKEKGNVWVSASVYASVLRVDGGLIDSTLLIPYRDSVIIQNKNTLTVDTKYITLPPEKYKTKFTNICIWWFFISVFSAILAISILVLSKVYTAKFNTVLDKISSVKNKFL